MAHGLNSVLKRGVGVTTTTTTTTTTTHCKPEGKTGIGSRRIFSPQFKLQVLDSYRNDADCKGNQRATARKYGIHRRQIQKWLQAENTLRSGVSGKQQQQQSKSEQAAAASLNVSRQRDDGGGSASQASGETPRVPALTETPACWQQNHRRTPLDFATRAALCADISAPMDLSFKKPTPAPSSPPPPPAPVVKSEDEPSVTSFARPDDDVWDLSTKKSSLKRRREDGGGDDNATSETTSPKPVKLFKPYLDDDVDEKLPPAQPLYFCQQVTACSSEVYYLNNNNNLCCDYDTTYTLHELQPKHYYYHPYYPSHEYEPAYCSYEDPCSIGTNLPSKQRQSYSLDFKLSAIDCYYQDAMCKGNQRAVAAKYNVHRRQVQKWLKQAEELKSRNEVLHAVR